MLYAKLAWNILCFGTKKRGVFFGREGALLGSKTGTNKQTNKQTDKEQGCTKKNAQGVKSSSSSSLALVLDSSRAEACIMGFDPSVLVGSAQARASDCRA